MCEVEGGDVIHVNGVGHGHKWSVGQRLDEWLVRREVVDVVGESELLEDFEGVSASSHPVVVVSAGARTRRPFNRFDGVEYPSRLLPSRAERLALPSPAR